MKKNYFHNNGLSFSQFVLRCKNILTIAKRDLGVLNRYGVTLELLTSLEQKLDLLKDSSNYVLDVEARKGLIIERKQLQKQLMYEIALIRKQLGLAFEKGTSGYDVLFSKNLRNKSVDTFASTIVNFVRILEGNSEKLAQYNFTTERLAELSDLVSNFIDLYEQISGVHHFFKESASNRSDEREEINKLVRYIAGIGKTYWQQRNSVYCAEYNISRKLVAPTATDSDES